MECVTESDKSYVEFNKHFWDLFDKTIDFKSYLKELKTFEVVCVESFKTRAADRIYYFEQGKSYVASGIEDSSYYIQELDMPHYTKSIKVSQKYFKTPVEVRELKLKQILGK